LDGFVQIPCGHQDESANLLFGLCERAVDEGNFGSLRPDRSGGVNGLKRLIRQQVTAVAKRIVIGEAFVDQRVPDDLSPFAIPEEPAARPPALPVVRTFI
jgi:hypothetical protein